MLRSRQMDAPTMLRQHAPGVTGKNTTGIITSAKCEALECQHRNDGW